MDKNIVLIGEFGATNARLAVTLDGENIKHYKLFKAAKFSSVYEICSSYLKEIKELGKPKRAILGVAAPVLGDKVKFINSSFKFSQKLLKKQLGLSNLLVMNDLELQAHALKSISKVHLEPIGKKNLRNLGGTKILVVPGTGLGLAGIVENKIIATEGGNLNVPFIKKFKNKLTTAFVKEFQRIPTFEDFLSGKGILFIYGLVSPSNSNTFSSEEIFDSKNSDPNFLKSKEIFCFLLAVYLRNVSLIWGTTGGIFLSGSIIQSIVKELKGEGFRKEFENSLRMKQMLTKMPIYLINLDNLAFKGALNMI